MQVPKPPKKPVKPTPPKLKINRSIEVALVDYMYEDKGLAHILEEHFHGISLADIKIGEYMDMYENYHVSLVYNYEEDDEDYGAKMDKYHVKLEKYEEDRRQYLKDVEGYKQKLKIWHEEQLKGLTE